MRRYSLTHKLPQIIERDGGEWVCHYCGHDLIPPATPEGTEPYYEFAISEDDPPVIKDYNNPQWEQNYAAFESGDLRFWRGYYQLKRAYRFCEIDHVIPLSNGGTNDLLNLVAACCDCNRKKSDKSYEDFKREIQGRES